MIKDFNSFINENTYNGIKGTLFLESGANVEEDTNWRMTLDVSKLWSKFNQKQLSISDFNKQYADLLTSKGQNIINTVGEDCWKQLQEAIEDLKVVDEKASESIYDDIYDICDKNLIQLICEKKTQTNEVPVKL